MRYLKSCSAAFHYDASYLCLWISMNYPGAYLLINLHQLQSIPVETQTLVQLLPSNPVYNPSIKSQIVTRQYQQ